MLLLSTASGKPASDERTAMSTGKGLPLSGPMTGRLARPLAGLGMMLLLANVALQVFDVLCRWLLSTPQSWVADVQQVTLPVAIAACFPDGLWDRSMIRIGFVGAAFGEGARRVLDRFGDLALLVAMSAVAVGVYRYAGEVAASGRGTWMLQLPLAPTWYVVSALFGVATLVQAAVLFDKRS